MSQKIRHVRPWVRFLPGLVAGLAVSALGVRATEAAGCGTCVKAKAHAAKPATSAPAQAQGTAAAAADQPGVRAFIDPTTGRLREPTPEETAALTRFLAAALALPGPPQIVQHANGALSAQLGEDYMNDVVVRRNPDGTLSWVCVPHPLSESVLKSPPSAKKPELETE